MGTFSLFHIMCYTGACANGCVLKTCQSESLITLPVISSQSIDATESANCYNTNCSLSISISPRLSTGLPVAYIPKDRCSSYSIILVFKYLSFGGNKVGWGAPDRLLTPILIVGFVDASDAFLFKYATYSQYLRIYVVLNLPLGLVVHAAHWNLIEAPSVAPSEFRSAGVYLIYGSTQHYT